jgi:hypothetical protein
MRCEYPPLYLLFQIWPLMQNFVLRKAHLYLVLAYDL